MYSYSKSQAGKKEHSPQFLLTNDLINLLDFIADFEKVSRAKVVDRAITYARYRGKYEEKKAWESSAKIYKKARKNSSKKVYANPSFKPLPKAQEQEARAMPAVLFGLDT